MIKEISKPQAVRLIDVFVLAPFMVYVGLKRSNLPRAAKAGMVMGGVLTAIYNGRNFMINWERAKAEEQTTDTRLGSRKPDSRRGLYTRPERSSNRLLAPFN